MTDIQNRSPVSNPAGTALDEVRLAAAELSGGISSGPIYSAAIAAAFRAEPGAVTILDYGSGVGKLLPLLRRTFPNAALHAADIMDAPSDLLAGAIWHRGDLNDRLPIEDASFDLICAIEVIEHLENPRHVLREVSRLLRPGGAAVLTTPNPGSLRSLLTFAMRGHHAGFDESNYPAHITPVAAVDFERAGAEAGLTLEAMIYTDDGMVPKLLAHRWQKLPLVGKSLRGNRFSDNYGVVLRKP